MTWPASKEHRPRPTAASRARRVERLARPRQRGVPESAGCSQGRHTRSLEGTNQQLHNGETEDMTRGRAKNTKSLSLALSGSL